MRRLGGLIVTVLLASCTTPNPYQKVTPVVCMPGTYITSRAMGVTMPQTCGACPSGTFSTSTDAQSCSAWTVCVPGTFVFNVPSASEDRECLGCPDDTYSAQANLGSCLSPTACAAGTVLDMQVTATTDQTCDTCGPGNYCAGGAASEHPCADGTWDDDANPATACVAWSECVAGEYVSSPGDSRHDRVCSGCASGTLSTTGDAQFCAAWSDCAVGTYVSNVPSATVDRTCTACAADTTTTEKNESVCQPVTACPEGTQGTPPSCATCSAGSYCAGGSAAAVPCAAGTWDHDNDPATACVAQTACVAGQSVASAGDATHDRTCAACASGTFSTMQNENACAPWTVCHAPDQFVAHAGSASSDRACGTCADPTFSSSDDSPTCDQACRNSIPQPTIVANAATSGEQDLPLAWTCTYQSCQLPTALDGSKSNTLHAAIADDPKQCTTSPTFSYGWSVRYVPAIAGGAALCTAAIGGASTDTLTLGADALPDLSSQPAANRWFIVQLTVDTSAGSTYDEVASFGLLYANSTLDSAGAQTCP